MFSAPIPIFFSCDDHYIAYCAVALRSLIDNADPARTYHIHILNTGLSPAGQTRVSQMARENVRIFFDDVTDAMKQIGEMLDLRDYYTAAIYFRVFIPRLFPQYEKGIYLDSDVVVPGDISRLYDRELGDCLVGAVADDIIASRQVFIDYAERGCGIAHTEYFNSGVLLMNLAAMREYDLEGKYIALLTRYRFNTICPDQDYLNVLCYGRVLPLPKGWNKMSIDRDYAGMPDIIHYNMFAKPWQHDGIAYGEVFWQYAQKTAFYAEIVAARRAFGKGDEEKQESGLAELVRRAGEIADSERNCRTVLFAGVRV